MSEWLRDRFELSRGGRADNLRTMEGLRGLAVFLVFLVHYTTLIEPWLPKRSITTAIAGALHTLGNAGVDLFFVLSGYLIYGSLLAKRQNFLAFMRRRIERIYPTFITMLAIYIALSVPFRGENKIPAPLFCEGLVYIAQNALLLPGLFPIPPIITVAWSLSYEMFYYLTIPAIIGLTGMRAWSSVGRITFFLFLCLVSIAYFLAFGHHLRLVMFIAGIFLYECLQHRLMKAPPGGMAFLLLIVGLLSTLIPITGVLGALVKAGILFVCFFVLCLSCFAFQGGILDGIFTWTPLRWLGNMSYSYYLIHGLTLKAAFLVLNAISLPRLEHGEPVFWLLMPVMFALTLISSTSLFLLIERPFSLRPKRATNQAVQSGTAPAEAKTP